MSKRFKDAEKWSKGSNVRHKERTREEAMNNEGGNVWYSCGHVIWDVDFPQDADWKSEVECPNCAALANSESLIDAGVFDLEREIKG